MYGYPNNGFNNGYANDGFGYGNRNRSRGFGGYGLPLLGALAGGLLLGDILF